MNRTSIYQSNNFQTEFDEGLANASNTGP